MCIAKQKLSDKENLIDLLSTAFYGNYWFVASTPDASKHLISPESECREDKWADVLLGGGEIEVLDEEEDKTYKLDMAKLVEGLKLVMANYPKVSGRILSFDGSADMIDADCVIQHAIFKEWVYG